MQKINWWLDQLLFLFFGLLAWPQLTGILFHEWLGVFFFVLSIIHLWLHRAWLQKTLSRWRFLSKTVLVRWLVDFSLSLTLSVTVGTGFVLAFHLGGDKYYPLFLDWHLFGTLISLGLLLSKVVLHRRCLFASFEKIVLGKNEQTKKYHDLPLPSNSRRDFLKLSGLLVGGVLLGGYQLKEYLQNKVTLSTISVLSPKPVSTTATDLPTTSPTSSPTTIPSTPFPVEQAISNNCQVRCPNGCSFPGRCRRYTDDNQNQLCDLGECL